MPIWRANDDINEGDQSQHRPVNTRPLGMLRQRRAGCSTLHERPLFRLLG